MRGLGGRRRSRRHERPRDPNGCFRLAVSPVGHPRRRFALGAPEVGPRAQQLAIAGEIGYRRGKAEALRNLGVTHAAVGQVEKAILLLEQALEIGRAIKDPEVVGFATEWLKKLRSA